MPVGGDRPGSGELAGSTLAVVGFGGIGRAVAALGHAIGMRVLVHARSVEDEALAAWPAPGALEEAFAEADVVGLHLPLTAQTRA